MNEFLYFNAMANTAFHYAHGLRPDLGAPRLWGAGVGVQIDSPAGLIEAVYGIGSRSLAQPSRAQNVFTIALGNRF
jgi:hypothetical protein